MQSVKNEYRMPRFQPLIKRESLEYTAAYAGRRAIYPRARDREMKGCHLSCSWAATRARIGQLTHIRPVQIHDENLVLATGSGPERREKDLPPVSRPRWSSAAPGSR